MLNKGTDTRRNEHQCGNRTEPQDYRLGDWMMRMKMCLLLLKTAQCDLSEILIHENKCASHWV